MSNKRKIVLLYSFIAFLVISLTIHFCFEYFGSFKEMQGLILGVIIMVSTIPLFLLGKKNSSLYVFTFLFNIIGVGFSITSYYTFKHYPLDLTDYATAFSVSMAVLAGFGLISTTATYKRHPILYTAFIILVCFITSLSLWISVESFSGLTFYYLNVAYFFMIGMIAVSNDIKHLEREMAIISYGAFILVSIIVLLIITDGEVFDGVVEISSFDIRSNKKKKKL